MPRLVMRLSTVQAVRASTFCADRIRARRLRPIKNLVPVESGFHERALPIADGFLPAHSTPPGEHLDVLVTLVGSVSAVSLRTAFDRGGMITVGVGVTVEKVLSAFGASGASGQTSDYHKLYQAAEIRSRSAATRWTWMTRRRASETVWLM